MKLFMKVISFLVIALSLLWMVNTDWFAILKSGDLDKIDAYFDKEIHIGLLITLLLMAFQNMFTIIPLVLVVTINILLYDFLNGFLWSWLTSIAGSLIAFLLYRYWLQSFLSGKINTALNEKIERNGFLFVFYMRLLPFAPSGLINIAAGASSIKFSHYFGATAFGNMIHIFLIGLIINGLFSAGIQDYVIPILLLALLPCIYFYKKYKRRVRSRENNEVVQK